VTGISRRRFILAAAGATGAAVAVGACTDAGGGPVDPDLAGAAAAASTERVAIDTYETIRTKLMAGRLGAAGPDAIVTFVVTAADQHHKALEAWNGVLTAGRRPVTDAPDRRLKPVVDLSVTRLTDVVGVARLSLQLEDYVSQVYLQLIPTLKKPDTVKLAGQILVVDQQHQAVLRYVLGLYPVGTGVDNPAQPADFAFAPADPRATLVTG
jgi:hypothetical protein